MMVIKEKMLGTGKTSANLFTAKKTVAGNTREDNQLIGSENEGWLNIKEYLARSRLHK